jgi:hypothetical protein
VPGTVSPQKYGMDAIADLPHGMGRKANVHEGVGKEWLGA